MGASKRFTRRQFLNTAGSAAAAGITVADARAGDLCILAAGSNSPTAKEILKRAGVRIADAPQALGLIPGKASGKYVLLVCGSDSLGLVYGLLDLADRVHHGAGATALQTRKAIVEQPVNRVRSVTRLFVSNVEDKPSFNDREMWPRYLTMLASQRFNRFNLSFGIGYDFLRHYSDQLLKGERDGRYSPVEVAQWIEDYSAAALKSLAQLDAQAGRKDHPEYRRLAIDVAIEAGLGRFFAAKFRSGVLCRIYERSGDRTALEESLKAYRAARAAWAELANLAKSVYVSDITEAMGRPKRASLVCRHTPPENFRTGQPLKIALTVERPVSVRLHYRHVNQAERWESVEMKAQDGGYSATLAGSYTDSNYPLQYYFELKQRQDTPVSILDL